MVIGRYWVRKVAFAPRSLPICSPQKGVFNLIVLFFSLCNNAFLDRTERDHKPSLLRSFCPSSFPPGELGLFLFSFSHRHFIEHASCCLVHTFDNVAVYVHRSFYVCVSQSVCYGFWMYALGYHPCCSCVP